MVIVLSWERKKRLIRQRDTLKCKPGCMFDQTNDPRASQWNYAQSTSTSGVDGIFFLRQKSYIHASKWYCCATTEFNDDWINLIFCNVTKKRIFIHITSSSFKKKANFKKINVAHLNNREIRAFAHSHIHADRTANFHTCTST